MKNKKVIIYITAIILVFIYLYWYGQMNQARKAKIAATGIETVGTVIGRSTVRSKELFPTYSIKFDFEYNGKRVVSSSNPFASKWDFENAIIGMKYKVKHLPDSPNKNAEIYIDKPIKGEYVNIEKERERILNTYKDAKVSLKKNARPLEKIQYLIP